MKKDYLKYQLPNFFILTVSYLISWFVLLKFGLYMACPESILTQIQVRSSFIIFVQLMIHMLLQRYLIGKSLWYIVCNLLIINFVIECFITLMVAIVYFRYTVAIMPINFMIPFSVVSTVLEIGGLCIITRRKLN